ncbi:alkaline phosphatase D family protein [Streptomyces alkaliterrae]|uniref:Alkaline phosphatase n=1 Tax=Streptomyces alkaliterrae TaxID=2213162 RepID=A0A5P0YRM2_9ACTN|nr:alkaline phosphatase D family protein [Streptomyces alkaliterrae]MBB1253049.1 alkaline phosphatase D family protein [Streptomyces alkaliterrae]MBB1257874.1 alkaline phosphatase D family protein [Streptomyces alkaliterrae]MQS02530.1 alkaline phosphatase [Streptomyces alkaliterrae]
MTHSASADRELRAYVRHLNRRRFLTVAGAASAIAFATNLPDTSRAVTPLPGAAIRKQPFTLGVASGDPLPGSVVLWTRLAPDPYQPDSGLPDRPVPVRWEIARDVGFRRRVGAGVATAHPEFHHSVHVEPDGLEPATTYYYRFLTGGWTSPVGRTRTAPGPDADPARLRFGVVSCQRYDQGHYTAYRHLAEEDLDAVLHVGDYLYEYPVKSTGGARGYPAGTLPAHFDRETMTLTDYRLRYSLYRRDPDLRAAHAAHPWIVTWDDHETENNYAGDIPEKPEENLPPAEFLLRRAAAYRAYWENMPLRAPQRPEGPDLRLYRRLRYGRLAQLDVLDTRQYRDDQANGDGWKLPSPESEDPARTMLGATQERWLLDGWRESRAVWNLVPQQVVFARRRNRVAGPWPLSMDAWDGYPAARARVLRGAREAGVPNLVFLTGDVHVHYAFDVHHDPDRPDRGIAAVELVTTSVSSGGDGARRPANWQTLTDANPHLRFYDGRRGYLLVTLDARRLRADFRTVDRVTTPGAEIGTAASFVCEAGAPGLRRA